MLYVEKFEKFHIVTYFVFFFYVVTQILSGKLGVVEAEIFQQLIT